MRARYVSLLLVLGCLLAVPRASAYVDETRGEIVIISPYRPTYALLGKPDTKIQLSFKGRVVDVLPVYVGYTQLMFWDLFKPSAPIRDVNYNPDVFYRVGGKEGSLRWLDVGAYEHESNGKGGADSRSWDRSYLRYSMGWKLQDELVLSATAKAWVPYRTSDNPGMARYRGLAEFTVALSGVLGRFFERDDLMLRFYFGGATYVNPLQGGQELTLRAKARGRRFLPLVVVQLFHGYGEGMLDYRERRTGLRAGIGF